jgi:hypothetical protein
MSSYFLRARPKMNNQNSNDSRKGKQSVENKKQSDAKYPNLVPIDVPLTRREFEKNPFLNDFQFGKIKDLYKIISSVSIKPSIMNIIQKDITNLRRNRLIINLLKQKMKSLISEKIQTRSGPGLEQVKPEYILAIYKNDLYILLPVREHAKNASDKQVEFLKSADYKTTSNTNNGMDKGILDIYCVILLGIDKIHDLDFGRISKTSSNIGDQYYPFIQMLNCSLIILLHQVLINLRNSQNVPQKLIDLTTNLLTYFCRNYDKTNMYKNSKPSDYEDTVGSIISQLFTLKTIGNLDFVVDDLMQENYNLNNAVNCHPPNLILSNATMIDGGTHVNSISMNKTVAGYCSNSFTFTCGDYSVTTTNNPNEPYKVTYKFGNDIIKSFDYELTQKVHNSSIFIDETQDNLHETRDDVNEYVDMIKKSVFDNVNKPQLDDKHVNWAITQLLKTAKKAGCDYLQWLSMCTAPDRKVQIMEIDTNNYEPDNNISKKSPNKVPIDNINYLANDRVSVMMCNWYLYFFPECFGVNMNSGLMSSKQKMVFKNGNNGELLINRSVKDTFNNLKGALEQIFGVQHVKSAWSGGGDDVSPFQVKYDGRRSSKEVYNNEVNASLKKQASKRNLSEIRRYSEMSEMNEILKMNSDNTDNLKNELYVKPRDYRRRKGSQNGQQNEGQNPKKFFISQSSPNVFNKINNYESLYNKNQKVNVISTFTNDTKLQIETFLDELFLEPEIHSTLFDVLIILQIHINKLQEEEEDNINRINAFRYAKQVIIEFYSETDGTYCYEDYQDINNVVKGNDENVVEEDEGNDGSNPHENSIPMDEDEENDSNEGDIIKNIISMFDTNNYSSSNAEDQTILSNANQESIEEIQDILLNANQEIIAEIMNANKTKDNLMFWIGRFSKIDRYIDLYVNLDKKDEELPVSNNYIVNNKYMKVEPDETSQVFDGGYKKHKRTKKNKKSKQKKSKKVRR